jgi:hypothetical protein
MSHAWHHVVHEAIHLDGRIFTTLKLLFTRPGQLTVDFLEGRRVRRIGPITLYLTTLALFALLTAAWTTPRSHFLELKTLAKTLGGAPLTHELEAKARSAGMTYEAYMDLRQERLAHLGRSVAMTLVAFNGLWLFLIFRKARPRLAEHLIMALDIASFDALAAVLIHWSLAWWFSKSALLGLVLKNLYFVFAARRVYGEGRGWHWLFAKYAELYVLQLIVWTMATSLCIARLLYF